MDSDFDYNNNEDDAGNNPEAQVVCSPPITAVTVVRMRSGISTIQYNIYKRVAIFNLMEVDSSCAGSKEQNV